MSRAAAGEPEPLPGDAAIAAAPPAAPAPAGSQPRALVEERDFLLRSLSDLDAERAVGDLDEADYIALREDYTRRAAEVLRRLGEGGRPGADGPTGADAPPPEAGAGTPGPAASTDPPTGAGAGDAEPPAGAGTEPLAAASRRQVRRRRGAVAFGVVLCLLGAGWAAAAESGVRLPGETITGTAVGPSKLDAELVAAAEEVTVGHLVQGMKDYQKVLDVQPDNPTALTGYAAVLVASDQAQLVARGAVMLAKAENADPSYAPAYAYLGRALVLLGDYGKAETQLKAFLHVQPTGLLATDAHKLLTYAESQRAKGSG